MVSNFIIIYTDLTCSQGFLTFPSCFLCHAALSIKMPFRYTTVCVCRACVMVFLTSYQLQNQIHQRFLRVSGPRFLYRFKHLFGTLEFSQTARSRWSHVYSTKVDIHRLRNSIPRFFNSLNSFLKRKNYVAHESQNVQSSFIFLQHRIPNRRSNCFAY